MKLHLISTVAVALSWVAPPCLADPALAQLLAAYPDVLDRIDGNELVWRDGTRMVIDDGVAMKTVSAKLAKSDIKDMLDPPYPTGAPSQQPASDFDPGRARNRAFFAKLYGDCRKDEVRANLVDVVWLPSRSSKLIKFNLRNGASAHLAAVSAKLDKLPTAFDVYLVPMAGSYNCRSIAGSDQPSAHGYGIAIDIAITRADYWRWQRPTKGNAPAYHNRIPAEIVAVFEAEKFIWGGRWSHYDTMHFEYRPELFQALSE